MPGKYRTKLPQLDGGIFLTDGGTETYLIYKKGLELPEFAAFHCLNDPEGYRTIQQYFRDHAAVARRHGVGFIFCSITYRASRDWGELLGYSKQELAAMNHKATAMLGEVAEEFETPDSRMVISGCIGPRGDAYKLNATMTAAEAEEYHGEQIATLKDAGVDMITGLTLSSTDEAIGIVRAAEAAGLPSVISFTVGAQGLMKGGGSLRQAVEAVDDATGSAPAYYMINCAHPVDFMPALDGGGWTQRIKGLRPNASSLDHGILCQLGHLEEGDPVELGRQLGTIARDYPSLNVWGGCCGTDYAHVEEICKNVMESAGTRAAAPAQT